MCPPCGKHWGEHRLVEEMEEKTPFSHAGKGPKSAEGQAVRWPAAVFTTRGDRQRASGLLLEKGVLPALLCYLDKDSLAVEWLRVAPIY